MKKRLDSLLVERGLCSSRAIAQALIMEGSVHAGDHVMTKPGQLVDDNIPLFVKNLPPYVSRGGLKLEKALNVFGVNPQNKICLDLGSSTGGFTDCLLQRGAQKVYAVDAGTNQLNYKLRRDPRVVVYEKTNAKYLKREAFSESPDLIVMDVSFISVKKLLPAVLEVLGTAPPVIVLLKPQFEGQREWVEKGGVVKSLEHHRQIVLDFVSFFESKNCFVNDFTYSPIKGGNGNVEYLVYLLTRPPLVNPPYEECITEAFRALSPDES